MPEAARSPSLAGYGVIGDRRSAALASERGSIDWWCPRRFDAPSALAAILDPKAGSCTLAPTGRITSQRFAYEDDTVILHNEWALPGGALSVRDLMPIDRGDPCFADGDILRVATCTAGQVPVRFRAHPRPAYGSIVPTTMQDGTQRVRFQWPDTDQDRPQGPPAGQAPVLHACATRPVQAGLEGASARADWVLDEGESVAVLLSSKPVTLEPAAAERCIESTRTWWTDWASRCRYDGPYRDAVVRSVLTLELLTYAPTGAPVAAPTTSLPAWPGGSRNWDYRYVWLRDTTFAVDALEEAGHRDDALRLGAWVRSVLEQDSPDGLSVLYRVDCSPAPEERELPLRGFLGSTPVRVGNGAANQFQLDVYGELVECLHLVRHLADDPTEKEDWPRVRALIERVRERWREPDHGIWEMRSAPRHFVFSKVMAWVALDRGVRAIQEMGLDGPGKEWQDEAEDVRAWVMANGVDWSRNTLVQAQGSQAVDASNLLVADLGFLPADHPVMAGTVEATRQDLCKDGLVHRYLDVEGDGVGGPEAAFTPCGFWLVEAMAQVGRRREAHDLMRRLLARGTPLGLFAEGIQSGTGQQMGNFPQLLSHIALTTAAAALARADGGNKTPSPHRQHAGLDAGAGDAPGPGRTRPRREGPSRKPHGLPSRKPLY